MPDLRITQTLGTGENIDGFPGTPALNVTDINFAIQSYLDSHGYVSGAGAGGATSSSSGAVNLSDVAPTTEGMGDIAAAGTSEDAARGDHLHGMPGYGSVVPQILFGLGFSTGFSPSVSRADHTHGTPAFDATSVVTISGAQTITGQKTFSAVTLLTGGFTAGGTASLNVATVSSTLNVTGTTTLGTLNLSSIGTKDVLTGGAGAGLGNLAAQTVDAYNIKDGAIISTKLSLPAVASVVASGAGNNTGNSFFRFAYTGNTYVDPVTSQQLSDITSPNGSSVVTDPQAYQNYAVFIPSGTASGTVGQSLGTGLTLPDGIYNLTVFLRVGSNASTSPAAVFTTSTTTGTATITGSPMVNANQLSTTGYMGYSFAVTLAGVTGLKINTMAQSQDTYVSHISGIPVAATFAPSLTSVFSPNVFATAATISSVSATSLTAGSIASDDIYLGTGGHIYAGTKGGARVELNAGGLYGYSNAVTNTFQLLNTGALTITGTVNATGGSFSGSITATGTITGGTISGAQFTNGSNFSVSPTGVLSAISGTIGGWTLGATTLNSTSALVSLNAAGYIQVNGTGISATLDGRSAQNLINVLQGATSVLKVDSSGNLTITGNINAVNGNFSGTITSTATISGGTISGTQFTNGSSFSVTPTGALTASNVTITGGTLSIGANFSVSAAGALTATSATITGTVNATGGTFSGSITVSGTISGGTISGAFITGSSISAPSISGGTLTSAVIQTATSGARVELGPSSVHGGIGINGMTHIGSGVTYPAAVVYDSSNNAQLMFYYNDGAGYAEIDGYNRTTGIVFSSGGNLTLQASNSINLNSIVSSSFTISSGMGLYDSGNRVYSPVNTPPYPVTAVNGSTGSVSVTTGSIGAATSGHAHTSLDASAGNTGPTSFGNDGTSERMYFPNTGTAVFRVTNGKVLNCGITGSVDKAFIIDHPSPGKSATNFLHHSCLEGPTADVYYRGEARLTFFHDPSSEGVTEGEASPTAGHGAATVWLPHYFEDIAREEGRTVTVTPILGCGPDCELGLQKKDYGVLVAPTLAVTRVVDGQFVVRTTAGFNHCCAYFFWEVKATRRDVALYDPEPSKAEYSVAGTGPYTYLVPKKAKSK